MELRRKLLICPLIVLTVVFIIPSSSQISTFPYTENFDSVATPNLPFGWSSTQNRTAGINDFTTSTSTPQSLPNVVVSTNATIGQTLYSPLFDFHSQVPDRLTFYTRRTATHLARVVVEASTDSGATYPLQLGDSLTNTGSTNYVAYSIVLPGSLANRSGVKLRWRIVADVSGSQGTFRIDDIVVTVQTSHDLALSALRFSPSTPIEQDSVRAFALVNNVGLQVASSFQVNFYNDLNNDSLPQPDEFIIAASNAVPLAVADSVELAASIGSFNAGDRLIIAQLVYQLDENITNDRKRSVLRVGYSQRSVVVNEIMYAPTNNEPEWVELYNTRSDSINIKDWLISDNNVATRRVISTTAILLPAHAFVVLTKDSAALIDVHPDIPSRIINIPLMPTLNNAGDAVVVYDARNAAMDSVSYLPGWGGNTSGKSLERIDPIDSSTAQSNWGTSRHPNRSTPGRRNSLTRKDFDITLDTLLISPPFPIRGDSVIVSARIRNAGFQAITSLHLSLFDDANGDSIPQPSEFITLVVHGNPLLPLDSVLISFVPFHPTRMEHLLIATGQTSPDEDTLNNRQLLRLLVGIPRSSVEINEIMYSPVSEPEWVELYNTTAESVDVKGWKLGNRTTSSRYNVAPTSIFIQPRKHAVIAKDTALLLQRYQQVPGLVIQASALPTFLFNNTGDAVVIFDQRDQSVDSVKYSATWGGNNGVSLERIDAMIESNDSANWSSSVDSLRGTPGRENSIVALDHDLRAMKNVTLVAPPYVSAMLSVTVQNIGRMASTPFDVTFFDDLNRDSVATPDELITSAHVAQSLARSETVRVAAQWPDPPAGIHTVVARVEYAPDLRPANNTTIFTVKIGYEPRAVVINEIMYAPFTNEAEYVELVNLSTVDVDLSGWKLLDRPGTSGSSNEFPLASQRRILSPGGYFIIASDSSIFSRFQGLDTTRHGFVTVANQSSLSFNNDGDAVIVRDATLGTIDSVAYSPTWHNPAVTDATGRSLEKINPSLPSNDARGWSTCVFVVGGTPGAVNSVYAASLPTQAKLSCSPNPFSPDGDGREDFSVIHYELPIDIAVVNLKIFDVKGRLIRYLVNSEPTGARRDVVWDGYDDERQRSRVGIYIVLVEGLNEGGGSVYSAKGVVVLAAKL